MYSLPSLLLPSLILAAVLLSPAPSPGQPAKAPPRPAIVVPIPADAPRAGEPYRLKGIRITADAEVVSASLHHRPRSAANFDTLKLSQAKDRTYEVELPADATKKPLEYYLEVKLKGRDESITFPAAGAKSPLLLTPDAEAPVLPDALKAAQLKSHGVTLNWLAARDDVGLASYHVFRGTSKDNALRPENRLTTITWRQIYWEDRTVKAGQTVWYAVQPLDRAGRTGEARYLEVKVPANEAPANTLAFYAYPAGNKVRLHWNGNLEPDVTTVELLRGEGKDGELKLLTAIKDLKTAHFLDAEVKAGTEYRYAARLRDAGGLASPDGTPRLVKLGQPFLRRINCGGEEVTGPDGGVWEADTARQSGSGRWASKTPVAGADEKLQAVYQSERWSNTALSYRFEVPSGRYAIVLHFAEVNSTFTAKGKRTFDVLVNGQKKREAVDVFAEVGANKAWQLPLEVEVKGATLDVSLRKVSAGPAIKGIEIRELPAAPPR